MIKVFLVEDEIIIRESIQTMIPWNDYGFELIGEATDGEMALPMIREKGPDLLITDIKMPFMDGLTLIQLVKKELPSTKIVIISGYSEFQYAQKAIALGVEQYLLKPISKSKFISILEEIRDNYEKENEQKIFYEKFQQEMQEYEQHSRQDFFAALVQGNASLQSIYMRAEELKIDIMSEAYNIILFSVNTIDDHRRVLDEYSESAASLQKNMELYFQTNSNFLLFRYQLFSYAVIIRGKEANIHELTEQCIKELTELFAPPREEIDWFLCTGKPVHRLSQLHESYQCALKAFAFRYLEDKKIIRYEEMTDHELDTHEPLDMENIDIDALNPDIIHNFLINGLQSETVDFVHNFLQLIGTKPLKSNMFRQYVLLTIHFNIISFLQKMGYEKEAQEDKKEGLNLDQLYHESSIETYLVKRLNEVILLREEKAKNQYKNMIESAVTYIENNYMDEEISLNKVARVANVSANHFSALFSQQMKRTFIEYLTDIRMKKAKELLRCTNMRSGRIAMEVGYRDSHYFSFLFKKTQKMTPSEYRNGGVKAI
ncbi:hypothetical protein lbkm_1121 [Lachnospiraceae bacterium KM106-2]|nr:hypothetical protein lbkm_1121 [Lachnospiraceae bacterium KM106-2]